MIKDNVVTLFNSGRFQTRLQENEVTIESLQIALDAAVFTNSIDEDGDIYVVDGTSFPFWMSIDQSSKMLHFLTYWKQQDVSINAVNQANMDYKAVQFCSIDNRVIANYFMTYHDGVDTRQVIIMIRHFSSVCRQVYDEMN